LAAAGLGYAGTLFADYSTAVDPDRVAAHYALFAGTVTAHGYVPGARAGVEMLEALRDDGYQGVWWQTGPGPDGPGISLRSEPAICRVVRPFPRWGPAVIAGMDTPGR
jgi:hypothetical protein